MLFKFISERPNSLTIWQTLNDTKVEPSSGYTDYQIKFMMFIILCMHDFKEAKQICNDILDSKPAALLSTVKKYIDAKEADIKSIAEPPLDLPRFVSEALYIPYYYLLQINDEPGNSAWSDLFERDTMSQNEAIYINTSKDNGTVTKYSLWKHANDRILVVSMYSKMFTLDTSLPHVDITARAGIAAYLEIYLYEYVEEHIFDYSEKIVIPPFRLVQEIPDEAQ